jgi:hypothetical protein
LANLCFILPLAIVPICFSMWISDIFGHISNKQKFLDKILSILPTNITESSQIAYRQYYHRKNARVAYISLMIRSMDNIGRILQRQIFTEAVVSRMRSYDSAFQTPDSRESA